MLTLGDADAVEQLRAALAVGCTAACHVEADAGALRAGRRRRARSPPWSATTRPPGTPHDLVLLGNDAADTGDFQVGIRLAYELGRPVVNGVITVRVGRRRGDGARRRPGRRHETFASPLPAVRHGPRGRRRAPLPRVPGRMKAKKVADRGASADRRAGRSGRRPAACCRPRAEPSGAGRGPRGAPVRSSTCSRSWGCCESDDRAGAWSRPTRGGAIEVSREALTFARGLDAGGARAWSSATAPTGLVDQLGGVRRRGACTTPTATAFTSYAAAAWAAAVPWRRSATRRWSRPPAPRAATRSSRTSRPGSACRWPRTSSGRLGRPARRVPPGLGGAALEEMRLSDAVAVFSVAGHACDPAEAETPTAPGRPAARRGRADADLRGPGRPHRAGGARPVRRPEVRPRRRRRRSRCRRGRRLRGPPRARPSCSTPRSASRGS